MSAQLHFPLRHCTGAPIGGKLSRLPGQEVGTASFPFTAAAGAPLPPSPEEEAEVQQQEQQQLIHEGTGR